MIELRIDDGQFTAADGRFKDRVTHYEGRKIKLPSFWMNGQRFTLSLPNMMAARDSVADAEKIVRTCADLAKVEDLRGVEQAALQLHQHCRELTGWKAKYKRDAKPRRLRPTGTWR